MERLLDGASVSWELPIRKQRAEPYRLDQRNSLLGSDRAWTRMSERYQIVHEGKRELFWHHSVRHCAFGVDGRAGPLVSWLQTLLETSPSLSS